ncbi:hypothetical protein AVEN_63195-1 [Araneus ventricosus]|uniref:Uncharacterized protein n=1 Tax=Araneus ventricosus TaxID=182803 RepID=A0A4Y2B0J7_ARAVE|nr:hypothetical protein AVEN_63195-1 [Araneus ventricosus]
MYAQVDLSPSCLVGAERPPVGVVRKFGEGVPAHVSSTSSDRGSKLRGPSQNNPHVASKRDVNITKLNSALPKHPGSIKERPPHQLG